jgi:hypothetical protein
MLMNRIHNGCSDGCSDAIMAASSHPLAILPVRWPWFWERIRVRDRDSTVCMFNLDSSQTNRQLETRMNFFGRCRRNGYLYVKRFLEGLVDFLEK